MQQSNPQALLDKRKGSLESLTYYFRSKESTSTRDQYHSHSKNQIKQKPTAQMTDACNQMNLTLTILNEFIIHMSTRTTKDLWQIQFHPLSMRKIPWHMDPHASKCQCRNCSKFNDPGQYAATLRTSSTGRSDTDTDYGDAEHIYNCHPRIKDLTVLVPQPCQKIIFYLPWHLGP